MALETFNYLDSLNPNNPAVTDGLVNGDDHMRGIKLALKNTFPNITGAVTASQADLNSLVGGVTKLNGAGVFFSTNTTDGFLNTLAGDIDVSLQGNTAATFQRTGGANFFRFHGQGVFDGEIKGPGITPIGGTILWWDDALPSDGLWTWANGQVIANANTVCPVLLARWGSRFGGNGVTTMGVPDMQGVVPVGKDGMGGAAGNSLLSTVAAGVKGVINTIFGAETVTLSAAQVPSITSNGSMAGTASGSISGSASSVILGGTSGGGGVGGGGSFGLSGNAGVSGTFSGSASVSGSVTSNNTGGQAHSNLGPRKVVNWITRLG